MPAPLDPALLERLPPELRGAVTATLEAERAARRDAELRSADLAIRVARLEHLIRELRRARFGRSSEKLGEDQLELAFEDIETAIAEEQEGKRCRRDGAESFTFFPQAPEPRPAQGPPAQGAHDRAR